MKSFLQWMCEKQFDVVKTKAILDVFIDNFIKMGQVAYRISTKEQALFYLKQAWYLTRILERTSPSFRPDVMEYREQIQEQETIVKKQAAIKGDSPTNSPALPPETPARNSVQFDFNIPAQPSKGILQRALSNKGVKKGVNFDQSSSRVKMAPSFKLSAKPSRGFRKSITFVEPQK